MKTHTFIITIDDHLFALHGIDVEEVIYRKEQAVRNYWERQGEVFRQNRDMKFQMVKMAKALDVCRKAFWAQRQDETDRMRPVGEPPPWEMRQWAEEEINEALKDYKDPFR